MADWWDRNPYTLTISRRPEGGSRLIDLGEPGWLTSYADELVLATLWVLSPKVGDGPSLWMTVDPQHEKAFYVARHIHDGMTGREVIAYGLGKHTADGMDRLWILPGNIICGSDDVEDLAIGLIRSTAQLSSV